MRFLKVIGCLVFVWVWVHAEPYQQDSMPDGVTVIEAEGYHAIVAAGGHSWVLQSVPVFSGGQAMQALPNVTNTINSGFIGASPRLDYEVNFVHAGTNYIVVRGFGEDYRDDTIHAGLDGLTETSDRVSSFAGSLKWEGDTLDGEVAYVVVPSPGVYTVQFWMREDGLNFDKFMITTNPDFFPRGEGPPLSPEGTNAVLGEAAPALVLSNVRYTNGMMLVDFNPQPSVEAYVPLSSSDPSVVAEEDGQASTFGYTLSIDTATATNHLFQVKAMPVEAEVLKVSMVLNRLAYGPTLSDLDDIFVTHVPTGASWWIERQLAPELISDSLSEAFSNVALRVKSSSAELSALRAWHLLQAVESERQLLEVLVQFFNNHFITYFWKNRGWFQTEYGVSSSEGSVLAAQIDEAELSAWREALLDPNATFYDLLKISAESPAMIIFLDTVTNHKDSPNENYAREIQELFTMGVDNGYTQEDIEEMARIWTGWRVGSFSPSDAGDPHAAQTTNVLSLLSLADTWSYREGTNEPPADWASRTFVEGVEWEVGQAPFGYGDGDDNTVLTNMQSNFSTVYARKTFTVADPALLGDLRLGVYFDDAFVAYINGTEVARDNVSTGMPVFVSVADGNHEASGLEFYSLSLPPGLLVSGTNVLGLQGLNVSLSSSDFSLDAELEEGLIWQFSFDPSAHDVSNKVLYAGQVVDARFGDLGSGEPYELVVTGQVGVAGSQEGYEVLSHLADLPYTQEYTIIKLCQLFVHEDFQLGSYFNVSQSTPEIELVRAAMEAWQDTAASPDGRMGNIRNVVRTIITSDLFYSQTAARQKVKTPFEFTVSAIRALRYDLGGGVFSASTDGYDLSRPMDYMDMDLFTRSSPDGFPEVANEWIDTSTIAERMRFIQNFLMEPADPMKADDYGSSGIHNVADPVALLQARLPVGDLTDATAVTYFFLDLLYPGEGTANLDVDLDVCLSLLNSDATGAPSSSLFSSLSPGSAVYDQRVRSLVGLLMSSPRFNVQ